MIPNIVSLHHKKIIDVAKGFPLQGSTKITNRDLFYLDIDDAYIHQLFPMLDDDEIKKPDYFGKKSAGAHVSIIYPEEKRHINHDDLKKDHHFSIKDIAVAEIGRKMYYVLLVESETLLQLRRKYNLPDLLFFKGYSIQFHITIGVKE